MTLFVEPMRYEGKEKTAAEVALPDDPNLWPSEVLQELYKQVPYISDFDPQPVMARVDADKGTGFGHVEVKNRTRAISDTSPSSLEAAGVKSARIPIIIRNGRLLPFDLLLTDDSKMLPLTEERLRQAIFRPQMFDVTGKSPGDQSVIGQLYPPHRDNFGYGGAGAQVAAGMGKMGAALDDTLAQRTGEFVGENLGGPLTQYAPHILGASSGALGLLGGEGRSIPNRLVGGAVGGLLGTGMGLFHRGVAKGTGKYHHSRDVKEGLEKKKKEEKKEKTSSILSLIVPTINPDDYVKFAEAVSDEGLMAAFHNNASCRPAFKKLAAYSTYALEKTAHIIENSVRPSVLQVSRVEGGYKIKSASHVAWRPKEDTIDRGRLVKMGGVKLALDADVNNTVTVAFDANVDRDLPEETPQEQVKDFGTWKVQQEDGKELVGVVFPTLYDFEGQLVPTSLFTNGSESALQPDIAGVRMGEANNLPEGPVHGEGIFYTVVNEGAVGTIPIDVQSGAIEGEEPLLLASTFDGQPLRIKKVPGIQVPQMIDDTTAAVPEQWQWLSLGDSNTVALVEQAGDVHKAASAADIFIRAGGQDSFSLSGPAIEKSAQPAEFLTNDEAVFLMAGLGIAPAYAQEKLACALAWSEPVSVRVGRVIESMEDVKSQAMTKAASQLKGFNMRADLVKEAAFIPDPLAVDTVLALGFINPENISTFINNLPLLEESQQKLCELLLGARVGLPGLDPNPVERAMKSLEEVLEGLKVLAFQKS